MSQSQWTPELYHYEHVPPAMLRWKMRGDQALHAKPCRWHVAERAYNIGLQTFAASVPEAEAMLSSVPEADPDQWLHGMKTMLLIGRGRARLNREPKVDVPFKDVLADAMEVNHLEPNGAEGLELFGVAMSMLTTSAPLQKWVEPEPGTAAARQAEKMRADGWSNEKIAQGQESAFRSFMHAMAADVWAMLLEDALQPEEDLAAYEPPEASKWREKAERSYAHHRKNASERLYKTPELAAMMMGDALAFHDLANPIYLMASYLMSLTYFRLGCRSPPLAWRPYHVRTAMRPNRIMEVVILHRIKQGEDQDMIDKWAHTVKTGL